MRAMKVQMGENEEMQARKTKTPQETSLNSQWNQYMSFGGGGGPTTEGDSNGNVTLVSYV